MAEVVGHAAARAAFAAAQAGGTLHHAWLLAGPRGVGKATFARAAALRMLAGTDGEPPADHPARALMAAGSHPDYRLLARLPKDSDKPDEDIARSITVAQVRALGPMFATAPSLSPRRVVVIDAADDLERSGANALLKSLEEPPAGTTFLLVSHAPGRLLPTIRSRCRLLRFEALDETGTAAVLRGALPEAPAAELAALAALADGSPGTALRYAGLNVAAIDQALARIAGDGDPANAARSALAGQLSGKAAADRYAAFLERAPAFIAAAARGRSGRPLLAALDAHAAARDLARAAVAQSLDATAVVATMAGLVARLHPGTPASA